MARHPPWFPRLQYSKRGLRRNCRRSTDLPGRAVDQNTVEELRNGNRGIDGRLSTESHNGDENQSTGVRERKESPRFTRQARLCDWMLRDQ
jgi:hypothetical protein